MTYESWKAEVNKEVDALIGPGYTTKDTCQESLQEGYDCGMSVCDMAGELISDWEEEGGMPLLMG